MASFKGVGCGGFVAKGKGPAGFVEEDRTRDWKCPACQERNFAKRAECFKCKSLRPADGGVAPKPPPPAGTTLNGMVKAYNKRGFGFLMVHGNVDCQDIYFTRDSVSSRLLHPDMPGEHVTFEIAWEGRRMVAKNIRPFGEERESPAKGHVFPGGGKGLGHAKGSQEDEDRTRDWNCSNCGERNFVKRFECFKCQRPRHAPEAASGHTAPSAPRRTFSPHAGSRAVRDFLAGGGTRSRSSNSRSRRRKRKRSRSKSTRSSSSRSRSRKTSRRKKGKSRRSSSSSSRSGRDRSRSRSSSSSCVVEGKSRAAASGLQSSGNPEIDKAKSEALEQLLKLKSMEPKDTRMREWRALLRLWHPDKNPQRVEVATAVFQFLQKAKPMLDA